MSSSSTANDGDEEHADELVLINGKRVRLHAEPQTLSRTTGWTTWNASLATVAYLERLLASSSSLSSSPSSFTFADLSTGNGLVAIAAALLGATSVEATEIPTCSALPRANAEANGVSMNVRDYAWGDDLPDDRLFFTGKNLVTAVDLLFIAVRDGLEERLRTTLVELCRRNDRVVFAFEERLVTRERAFVETMRKILDATEIERREFETTRDDDGDLARDMFHEPPPVRMYELRRRRRNDDDDDEGAESGSARS